MKTSIFIFLSLMVVFSSFGQWTNRTNSVTTTKKLGIGIDYESYGTLVVYDPNFSFVNVHSDAQATNGSLLQLSNDNSTIRNLTLGIASSSMGASWLGLPIQKSALMIANGSDISALIFGTRSSSPIIIGTSDIEHMRVTPNGNIGIGTDNPISKLSVDGEIRATGVKVMANVEVPDYVFEPDYELRTLKETKEYISEKKHLPEIPSASEIGENGIDLGEMNMLLLKKIEEMTLYQIEIVEKLEKLQIKVEKLEKNQK